MMNRRKHTGVVGQVKRRKNNGPAVDTLAVLPDELLEHILLGVGSPIDLVHAASACKRWRRLVADAGFLRRICALHNASPVAGNYYNSTLKHRDKSRPLPSFVSSSSSTTMADDGHHYSLDFLPDADVTPAVWSAMGSRGSLLVLHHINRNDKFSSVDYWDMVICEPLMRRYVRISPAMTFDGDRICSAYLCDGDDGGIGIGNFKLLCLLDRCVGVLSSDGSWHKTSIDGTCMILKEATDASVYFFTGGRTMAAVDRRSADVSYFLLPDIEEWDTKCHFDISLAVTSGDADGRDRFVFTDKDGSLKVFARTGGDGMELALEQIIRGSEEVTHGRRGNKLRDIRKRLHLCTWIRGTPMIVFALGPRLKKRQMWCINVETLEVEDVTDRDDFNEEHYPCKLPWPPVLNACTADR